MTILDRPTTPSLSTEPVSTAFAVDAVDAPPRDADEPGRVRGLLQVAAHRLLSLGAATPRLLPALQGVVLLVALGLAGASSAAHAVSVLRRAAMWMAIALAGGIIGTIALCSPPRDPHRFEIGPDPDWRPLPAAVPSDAEMVALGRVS